MKNIKFKECNVEIGKDQKEYKPLYACDRLLDFAYMKHKELEEYE